MPAPTASSIRFKATLLQPDVRGRRASWVFLVLPKSASARLGSRGSASVAGFISGHPFKAVLEPDGQKSHWLKVTAAMRKGAAADVGEVVMLEIAPAARELEPKMPPDLRRALAAVPAARTLWKDITPIVRRDWVQWITSAKQPGTRARRIRNACDMLSAGKGRVCCFDRSGFYSKGLGAPKALVRG